MSHWDLQKASPGCTAAIAPERETVKPEAAVLEEEAWISIPAVLGSSEPLHLACFPSLRQSSSEAVIEAAPAQDRHD